MNFVSKQLAGRPNARLVFFFAGHGIVSEESGDPLLARSDTDMSYADAGADAGESLVMSPLKPASARLRR